MTMSVASPELTAAHDAFARRDWHVAFERLVPLAEAGQLGADDEQLLADVAGILWDEETSRRAAERARAAFEREGRCGEAAVAATMLFRAYRNRGEMAVARGWLQRAERLAESAGPEHVAGVHVLVARAFAAYLANDDEAVLRLSDEAAALARRFGERSLEAMAINRRARALLRTGRVAEGQASLDEAMAIVSDRDVDPVSSLIVYCSTIDGCTDVADYARAGEWTQAATEFCEQHKLRGWGGLCRIHRAELWRVRGAWELAAREIESACSDLRGQLGAHPVVGIGLAEKGVQRLRLGDVEGAAAAFREAHETGVDPQPGLAQLWLHEGKHDEAVAALRQVLQQIEGPLERSRILPTFVEALIAARHFDEAAASVTELESIADRFTTTGLRAHALSTRGALELAKRDLAAAPVTLRKAIRLWHEVGSPYEVARARALLSHAHEAQGQVEASRLEREAARAAFARLGASLELARTPPRGEGPTLLAGGDQLPRNRLPARVPDLVDGKLEIVRKLGEGGMGAVWLARHRLTGRQVAVKMLRPGACDDAQICGRLLQEALASGQIKHPNVVDVYDAGSHEGTPYLVLEYLEGESLAQALARRRALPPAEVVPILTQVLAGVGAAHRKGIVHRDLKPDNIFLVNQDEGAPVAKVLDFGIAKLQTGGAASTGTGALLGTPYYMAPEQVEGLRELDGRVDIYALGVVLFECLTGRRPFVADSHGALLLAIVRDEFPSVLELRPELPAALDELVRDATRRDRDARLPTVEAFTARVQDLASKLT